MIEYLLESNEYLIRHIANKFYNVEKEDLYQAGRLGLIKAYKNYKKENGEFSSYAYKYIFGEMYELSMKSRNIRLNKNYLKLYKSINKAKSLLTQKLGREVTLKDVSDYLEIPLENIEYVYVLMENCMDLDEIEIGKKDDCDEAILLKDSLNSLDDLSQKVIKYRYYEDYTQKEVGDILGISQVKVSRIESNSKKKILEYIR